MLKTKTWWDSLFSGDLSIGISLERQQELEDEEFLFLQDSGEADIKEEVST